MKHVAVHVRPFEREKIARSQVTPRTDDDRNIERTPHLARDHVDVLRLKPRPFEHDGRRGSAGGRQARMRPIPGCGGGAREERGLDASAGSERCLDERVFAVAKRLAMRAALREDELFLAGPPEFAHKDVPAHLHWRGCEHQLVSG